MKRSRFSEEQIIGILKEQEAGMPTAEVCRRHGVSPATFYKWKSKFGGDIPKRGGRPHSKLGGRTPAEIAKQAVPGHAPALLVIPSTISQTMEGLYF